MKCWKVCLQQILFTALDLKKGEVYQGEPGSDVKVDTTLTIDDQDMVDLVSVKSIL